ncbi:DUF1367 family protein [Prevotella sp.]|jgi:hypothetical protein|uniref:DUF1367 family protein n=1 Tax=Prevotella sp. TaxID=59823 RepID=UPI002A9DDA54|nr:DUF1367 family protein [Prevotella sp.]
MDIYCRVTDIGLIPMYDSDLDEKHRLRIGDNVLCTIKRPRNYEFHKKYFALLRLTVANLPHLIQQQMQIFTEEDLLDCLKIDLGLFTTRWHGGRQIVKTGSISFAKMDNTEFEKFFSRSVDAILRIYLRGTDRQALIEEVENYK